MTLLRHLILVSTVLLAMVLPATAQSDGRAVVTSYLTEGVKLEGGHVTIFIERVASDGERELIFDDDGPEISHHLPPGDYVATVSTGFSLAEQPFVVTAGEVERVGVVLNAGVLAMDAPSINAVYFLPPDTDVDDSWQESGTYYFGPNASAELTVTAGDYLLLCIHDDDSKPHTEMLVTIVAGERLEIAID